jgi:Protein of unknown function (DUF2630)
MSEGELLQQIDTLVMQVHRLRAGGATSRDDRLVDLEARIAECWGKVRERRARVESVHPDLESEVRRLGVRLLVRQT